MPVFSFEQVPKEVQELLHRSREQGTPPIDICRDLDRLGVGSAEKIVYLCEALGLPFAQAKEVVVRFECGSVEAWAEETSRAIDEIASEVENPKQKMER